MKITQKIVLLFIILMSAACSDAEVGVNDKHSSQTSSLLKNEPTVENETNDQPLVSIDSCGACHGKKGVSSNRDWPNLAGQQSDYLYQQLLLFKEGKRVNLTMNTSLLERFSDQDLRSIADQYSTMETVAKVDENAHELPGAHVRARCISCHSMSGNSVTSLWPNLAGQQAGYLENQLLAYKDGSRVHPTMQVIASELTEKQIKDVAEYYSKVNP